MDLKLIEELTNAFGPSGFENDVLKVAKKYIKGSTFEDSTNNLYINLPNSKSDKFRIMIDAHADEVGMMVHHIKPNGTIGFITLAGIMPAALIAQKVLIRNKKGQYITGIVVSKPPHFSSINDLSNVLTIEDLSIDVGASNSEETEREYKIGVGCPIVPKTNFEYNEENGIMMAKAFDCRLGCAAAIDVLNTIDNKNIEIVGTLSSQEEIGIRGANITPRRVLPDIAIVFEGTPADDTILDPPLSQTYLNKGPMLRHIDKGMITHPRFLAFALEIANKHNIPVQEAVRTKGATNGQSIHLNNLGIPTIVIGIPVRYIHTHHSIASVKDYNNAVILAKAIINEFDNNKIIL